MEAAHSGNRTELDDFLAVLTKNNYSGRQFEARNPGVIRWRGLIPPSVHSMALAPNVQGLLRQFDS